MSRLLWFLIGSAATLVAGAVAANYMDDDHNHCQEYSPQCTGNISDIRPDVGDTVAENSGGFSGQEQANSC